MSKTFDVNLFSHTVEIDGKSIELFTHRHEKIVAGSGFEALCFAECKFKDIYTDRRVNNFRVTEHGKKNSGHRFYNVTLYLGELGDVDNCVTFIYKGYSFADVYLQLSDNILYTEGKLIFSGVRSIVRIPIEKEKEFKPYVVKWCYKDNVVEFIKNNKELKLCESTIVNLETIHHDYNIPSVYKAFNMSLNSKENPLLILSITPDLGIK